MPSEHLSLLLIHTKVAIHAMSYGRIGWIKLKQKDQKGRKVLTTVCDDDDDDDGREINLNLIVPCLHRLSKFRKG